MDLNEVMVFVKVVQAGSFSEAARQLAMPNSTVSVRVARLEQRLGVTLLQRTTRRLRLTEEGEVYFREASHGLSGILEAEAALTATLGEPQGLLRITTPIDIGQDGLARLITRVRQRYPKISLELIQTERFVDLVAEGVDLAIRAGQLQDSSLVAKRVGTACWVPFASPDYLRNAPPLEHPRDLRHHVCLQFTPLGKDHWELSNDRTAVSVPLQKHVVGNDMSLLRLLALSGQGVALLPTYACLKETKSEKLVRVLPEWRAKADPVHLVYPRQKFVAPKLRAFVDMATPDLRKLFAY